MKPKKFNKKMEHGMAVANKSFAEVFKSMQLLNLTVLYYDFDFDKESIKAYNANITKYNNECLDCKETFFAEEERILKVYRFSCEESAKVFPTRAKMKMIGVKKFRSMADWDIALQNATDAINVCLVLFLHEFINVMQPSISDVALYWRCMRQNAENYANGMTDDFVVQYFRDQIDLDIQIDISIADKKGA